MHQDKFKVSYSHIPKEDWNRIFDRTWLKSQPDPDSPLWRIYVPDPGEPPEGHYWVREWENGEWIFRAVARGGVKRERNT